MNTQPTALRLAKILETEAAPSIDEDLEAAAELRRLHALNTEMLAVLKEADWYIDQLEMLVYLNDDGGMHETRAKVVAIIVKAEVE